MARRPEPGRVKTRLSGEQGLTPDAAAAVAGAMTACIVQRLAARGPVVVAVTPDGPAPDLAALLDGSAVTWADQGEGDLGVRLDRVWRSLEPRGPVAFFGIDSPDVPAEALDAIEPALAMHDAAAGPTSDGGYWTLAAGRHQPELLAQIDWGTGSVYDQTTLRAAEAGLRFASLPRWHDVDEPADLRSLRRRLEASDGTGDDRLALLRLSQRLDEACEGHPA